MKRIYILFFIFMFLFSGFSFATNEEEQRRQEAINIIESVNPSTSENSVEDYVYVTEDGSTYHKYGCDEIKTTPHKITLSSAIDKGYSACEYCYGNKTHSDYKNITIVSLAVIIVILLIALIFKNKYILIKKDN